MDPRTIRTRQLIIDSFNTLIRTTDFQQISVKMITEHAQINRATFYAHFVDKYELLDVVLQQVIQEELARVSTTKELNARVVEQLFMSIASVHDVMHSGCRKGYDAFSNRIEEMVKEEMKQCLHNIVPHVTLRQLQMISWAIYGSFNEWQHAHGETMQQAATQTAQILQPMLHHDVKSV